MANYFPRRPREIESLGELMHEFGRTELLDVVRVLAEGPHTCQELSERIEVEHSAVCKRLRILRQLGFVSFRRQKNFHVYSLTDQISCNEHKLGVELTVRLNGEGEIVVRSRPFDSQHGPGRAAE